MIMMMMMIMIMITIMDDVLTTAPFNETSPLIENKITLSYRTLLPEVQNEKQTRKRTFLNETPGTTERHTS